MAIKILKNILIIATVSLLYSAKCNKEGTSCLSTRSAYSFAVTAEWSPQKEVYGVGDTIYLTSNFPKTLIDQINPSLVVDYSNAIAVNGDIAIIYMDTISKQPLPAKDNFVFISILGNFIERSANKDLGINTLYIETPTSYEFKGAVICTKKGIYSFSVSDLLSPGINSKNCTKASFSMLVTNTNKHLYLHQYALNINANDPFLQKHSYDFRVQ